ncbi:MAG: hypothetical protein R3E95_09880 [Thiolinea sp.]
MHPAPTADPATQAQDGISQPAAENTGLIAQQTPLRPPATEAEPDAAVAVLPEAWADLDSTLLFIDQDGHLFTTFQNCKLQGCSALRARDAEEALQLMEEHEVGVIIASIDGADRNNVGFLCLLKKEHPHVVSLAVARLGDSETIIGLVNSARIFRVIFHPLRPNVLRHHLLAAIKQVGSFHAQPALLKAQEAREVEASSSLMQGIGHLLKNRVRSLRSLFRKSPG